MPARVQLDDHELSAGVDRLLQRLSEHDGIVRSDATGSEQLVEPLPAPLRYFYPLPILLVPVMFLGVFGLIAGVVGIPGNAQRREG